MEISISNLPQLLSSRMPILVLEKYYPQTNNFHSDQVRTDATLDSAHILLCKKELLIVPDIYVNKLSMSSYRDMQNSWKEYRNEQLKAVDPPCE